MKAVREAAASAGRDPDDLTICVAAPAYVSDDLAHARDQCRWFGGMVGNHVADLVTRYGDDVTKTVPAALTSYIEGRHGYDYNEHGRAGSTHTDFVPDEVIGPELRRIAERHPSVGEVRGLGVFWAVELVRDRTTREPLVPYNAAGADAAPMAELATACKAGGVWPFTHFNRLHVVPPCTISEDEVCQGLAVIDDALAVADRFCT